jgi:cobalt-zinc-cadmium efflux system protein
MLKEDTEKHKNCDHTHDHGHHHHHVDLRNASLSSIRWAFWLNFCFAIIELAGGIWTNSVAIMSDAVHDFGDALAIGAALYLEKKSHSQSDAGYSYGYRRFSTASAVLTGAVLILGSIWVLVESLPRLLHPEAPKVDGMLAFAVMGVLVNGFGAYRMSRGKSLNERVITWHLVQDLLGWILVFAGALVMKFWDFPIIDPILGLILSVWILWNVTRSLKEGLKIFLQATPRGLDISQVEAHLKDFSLVSEVHHTHVWSMDGESHILTTHVVLKDQIGWGDVGKLKSDIKNSLRKKYHILEATIEFEVSGDVCLDPSHSGT